MKQIVQNMRSGDMSLLNVPTPQVGRGEVMVATKASLISAGTERMLIDFANKSLVSKAQERPDLVKKVIDKVQRDGLVATTKAVFSQLEEPLPLGYSAAGEVVAVGQGMEDHYKIGDRVSIAGAGIANHAELNVVPKNLIASVPENVSYEEASFATLTSIAMHGFRNSEATLGDHVLVMGLGLVGQLTAQLATAAGCHVFGVDYDPERIAIAEKNGIAKAHLLSAGGTDALMQEFTEGKGFDSIIICAATDSNDPIEKAASWARDRARIVMTGKTGTTIPYADYMKKELQFVVSRSYGPGRYDSNYEKKGQNYPIGYVRWTERENLQEALRLMGNGSLNVKSLISHSFTIEESAAAYELVMGKNPCLGVVLSYPRPLEERKESRVALKPKELISGSVGVSFIGAGAFASGVLIPSLKKMDAASFVGILSKGGTSAATTGDRFGFDFAAANEGEIWESANTQAVVIATRHDSHAQLVQDALKAGKHVFVEKPLALTEEGLEDIEEAYNEANKVLMVGYNRRFAPFVQGVKDSFDTVSGPRQVIIRVNAGKLEGDNWQNDPSSGGGRLLGEACHFIDLGIYLVGSKPTEVYATAGEGQDVYSITMRFEDGSVATLFYTSEGDSSYSKERIEVYAGSQTGVIDNFRKAFVIQNGKKRKFKLSNGLLSGGQDKGHYNELLSFVMAAKGEQDAPIPAEELFMSTRVTLLAERSMLENLPLKV